MTREEWLIAAVDLLRPLFDAHGYTVPAVMRVSCGWPFGSRKAIGQAWSTTASADATAEMFISPVLSDLVEVAATLVHEMVHITVGIEAGHKGPFAKCARKLGLEGKLTATHASKDLAARLVDVLAPIGPYPHATLSPSNAPRKVQGTRMIKLACACGYVCRTTRKWLEIGAPTCPCGEEMAEAA